MSEYIKREDVLQAIAGLLNVTEQIDGADVVEVVRCKDCKRRNTRACMMNNNVGMNKDLFDDDYCSYGEREEK